jgi:hypothetical protein
MTAREVIERARAEGLTLSAGANGKLRVTFRLPPPPDLLEGLKEQKTEILALLAKPACLVCNEADGGEVLACGGGDVVHVECWRRAREAEYERQAKPLPCPSAPPVSFAAAQAKQLITRLSALGFRAYLDDPDALLIADATGHRRDLSRLMDIADVFSKLVAGLEDEPDLLNLRGHQGR